MKAFRNLVVLSTFFVILFTSYNIKADAFAIDPTSIAGLGDIGYGLFSGAFFDFTDSKYLVDPSEVNNPTKVTEKVNEFISDYVNSRFGVVGAGGSIDLSYRSQNFDYNVKKIWNDYSLAENSSDQDNALMFELSYPSLSSWMKNNIFWYREYINSFAVEDDAPPTVVLPEEYSYIQNNIYLWVRDSEILNSDYLPWAYTYSTGDLIGLLNFNRRDKTYFSNNLTHSNPGNNNYYNLSLYVFNNIASIYLDTSTNSINIIADTSSPEIISGTNGNTISLSRAWTTNSWTNQFDSYGTYIRIDSISNSIFSYQVMFSSTSQAIQYIYNHFANFNLFVDGVCWSYIQNGTYVPPLIPDITDIINPNTDEPAYDIVLPNTDSGAGYFDLTSLLDRITQAIIGASDTDTTTSGILDKTGVRVVDTDRETDVATTNIAAIDVVVAENAQGDPDLPIIPLPPEIKNAFKGTSILAELIDGTQKVLPEDLVTVFWGIVCVIFIIGLIRVMHK